MSEEYVNIRMTEKGRKSLCEWIARKNKQRPDLDTDAFYACVALEVGDVGVDSIVSTPTNPNATHLDDMDLSEEDIAEIFTKEMEFLL